MPSQHKWNATVTVRLDPSLRERAAERAQSEDSNLTERVRQWIEAYAETGSPVKGA